ncbi:MAG: ribosome silencing factor [Pseudomonadota bacterium]
MSPAQLRDHVVSALDDLKGVNIVAIEVTDITTITDYMVLASGTSNRHVKALVDEVIDAAKQADEKVVGVEGRETHEWVLIDLGDVVVHVMQQQAREFYDLERLWADAPGEVDSEHIS